MKGNRSSYQLHLFTLRLWLEQLDHQKFEWRGEVKNPSTGEVHYFRSMVSLYNALLIMLDTPSQDILSQDTVDDGRADS